MDRVTASAMVAGGEGDRRWAATLAWGRNRNRPGAILDAVLLEGAASRAKHTVFARGEYAEKNELFDHGDPRHGSVYDVGVVEGGYRYDFWGAGSLKAGLGLLGTISFVPSSIQDAYGDTPASWMLFTRIALR